MIRSLASQSKAPRGVGPRLEPWCPCRRGLLRRAPGSDRLVTTTASPPSTWFATAARPKNFCAMQAAFSDLTFTLKDGRRREPRAAASMISHLLVFTCRRVQTCIDRTRPSPTACEANNRAIDDQERIRRYGARLIATCGASRVDGQSKGVHPVNRQIRSAKLPQLIRGR